MERSTQLTYEEQKIQYDNYVETLNDLRNVSLLSEKCVNQAMISERKEYFLQQLVSLRNLTSVTIPPLRDSVFNCSALPSCSISCSPPSEVILKE